MTNGADGSGSIPISSGETACVQRTGILAKRNTLKKAWKFKRLHAISDRAPSRSSG
jgi:hypothetical protein